MGLFQALLLAVSLGWTGVLADPSDSANASAPATPSWTYSGTHRATLKTLIPVLASSAYELSVPGYGSVTIDSPATMQTATSIDTPPTYASPVTMIAGTSLATPGEGTRTPKMPVTQPTATGLEVPGDEISRHGGSPTGGGGSPGDESGSPETYYVHGSAVVAGAAPTVIAGTTYSVAKTGGKVWVDGTATSAEGIVSTLAAVGSGSGSRISTPAAATGAAGRVMPPDIAIGAAFGLIALL